MTDNKALLLVDLQNDFFPGGALGIETGNEIVDVVNKYIDLFKEHTLPVFATRDWHPPETTHFEKKGGPWPDHCVQNTKGAEFHPSIKIPGNAIVLSKGTDPQSHGYSAFEAHDESGKSFPDILREKDIDTFYIAGLATDLCVRYSAMDAVKNGFNINILADAVRGVDPEESKKTLEEIKQRYGSIKKFEGVKKELG